MMVTIVGLILGNVQVRLIKYAQIEGVTQRGYESHYCSTTVPAQLHETIDLNGMHV